MIRGGRLSSYMKDYGGSANQMNTKECRRKDSEELADF